MSIRRFIIGTAILASTVVLSSTAQAQDAQVSFRSTDLTTEAGQKAVVSRIKSAVARACADGGSRANLLESRTCTRELTSQMIAKLDSQTLAATSAKGKNSQVASR